MHRDVLLFCNHQDFCLVSVILLERLLIWISTSILILLLPQILHLSVSSKLKTIILSLLKIISSLLISNSYKVGVGKIEELLYMTLKYLL